MNYFSVCVEFYEQHYWQLSRGQRGLLSAQPHATSMWQTVTKSCARLNIRRLINYSKLPSLRPAPSISSSVCPSNASTSHFTEDKYWLSGGNHSNLSRHWFPLMRKKINNDLSLQIITNPWCRIKEEICAQSIIVPEQEVNSFKKMLLIQVKCKEYILVQ